MSTLNFIEELVNLKNYGESVFEDKANFQSWLTNKSVALGNITPESLFVNLEGIEKVKNALGRIEHGIFS